MRLSEERIHFIAAKIIETLLDKDMLDISCSTQKLQRDITQAMIKDLRTEDEIEQEVINMIQSMSRDIPEDSPEWNSIFREKKEELARRRNYIY